MAGASNSAHARHPPSFPGVDIRPGQQCDATNPHDVGPRIQELRMFWRESASPGISPARLIPSPPDGPSPLRRSEEHTSELQSRENLVCRLLLEKKNY